MEVPAPRNKYDDLLDQQEQESRAKINISAGQDIKPETAAKVIKLSDKYGVPRDTAERQLPVLEKRDNQLNKYDSFLTNPAISKWMEDPYNQAVAKDDMASLGVMDWLIQAPQKAYQRGEAQKEFGILRNKSIFGQITAAEEKRMTDLRLGMVAGGELGADSLPKKALTASAEQLPQLLGALYSGAQYGVPAATVAAGMATIAGQLGPQVALPEEVLTVPAAAAVGYYVGHTQGAATYSFVQESGHAYEEFSKFTDEDGKPLDPAVAKVAALAAGTINAGLDVVQLGILMRSIPGAEKLAGRFVVKEALRSQSVRNALTDFAKAYGSVLAKESAIEVGQRAVTIIAGEVGKVTSGQEIKPREAADIAGDLLSEGVGALEAFSLLTLPGPSIRAGIDVRAAQRAKVNEQLFTALGEMSEGSKLRERLPEKMQELVARVTEDGPIENIYIDPRTWTEYFQSKSIDPRKAMEQVLGSATALDQALVDGHDLQIPTAKYASTIAATEHNKFFVQELKTDPLGMNAREADQMIKDVEAEIKEKQKAEAQVTTPQEPDIQTIVAGQLVQAGFEEKTAASLAQQMGAFFETQAQRSGKKSGLEMFKEYALRILGREAKPKAGGLEMDQPAYHGSGAKFEKFDLGQIGTGEGAQVHGWGMYFAKQKDAANRYKQRFSRQAIGNLAWEVTNYIFSKVESEAIEKASDEITRRNIIKDVRGRIEQKLLTAMQDEGQERSQWLIDTLRTKIGHIDHLLSGESTKVERSGRLYEVEIKADPHEMLDLDQDLDQQTEEILDALKLAHSVINPNGDAEWLTDIRREISGRSVYQGLVMDIQEARDNEDAEVIDSVKAFIGGIAGMSSEEIASRVLLKAGIKGLQYVGRQDGPSMVVFDDSLIDIKSFEQSPVDQAAVQRTVSLIHDIAAQYDFKWNGKLYRAGAPSDNVIGTYYAIDKENAEFYEEEGKKVKSHKMVPIQNPFVIDLDDQQTLDDVKKITGKGFAELDEMEDIALYIEDSLPAIKAAGYDGVIINGETGMMMEGTPIEVVDLRDPSSFEQPPVRNPFPQSVVQEVVYHGTLSNFKKFSPKSIGKMHSDISFGYYFSNNPTVASGYAEDLASLDNRTGENVRPSYINIKKPLIFDLVNIPGVTDDAESFVDERKFMSEMERVGITQEQFDESDGFIVKDSTHTLYVVFDSKQIKSAITLDQPGARGRLIKYGDFSYDIQLLESADLSTFLHESGHLYLEILKNLAKDNVQIAADMEVLFKWMGVENAEAIETRHHEQFARGLEAYFMEGKAPSIELRQVFARFRAWLKAIYAKLLSLDVRLNDDIRGVMDRMFATDAEILAAEREDGLTPMFLTAAEAQMTEAEFARYNGHVEGAHRQAVERLTTKVMDQWTREQRAWYREQRAAVRGEVHDERVKQPDVTAYLAMRYGRAPDGTELAPERQFKLDRDGLIALYGKDSLVLAEFRAMGLYRVEGGIHPDAAAELFGFKSGDELVQAVSGAKNYQQQVDTQTDAIMRERYGDILIDGTMHDEARSAVMNDMRTKVLHAELKALTRKRNEVQPFVQQEKNRQRAETAQGLGMVRGIPPLEVFQRLAKSRIASMQVRSINPHQFLIAARQAGTRAVDEATKNNFSEAAIAKQQELFNLELYRNAVNAREEVNEIVDYARDFGKTEVRKRIGRAGADYLDQIENILSRFDFTGVPLVNVDRRSRLADWITQKEREGVAVDLDPRIIDEAFKQNYKTLTFDELRGVSDALHHIYHLAKLKNRLLKSQGKRDLQAVVDEVETSIRTHAKSEKTEKTGLRLPQDEPSRFMDSFFASGRKIASYARQLDGFKDGGPVWEYLVRPLNEASNHEATMMHEAGKALKKLFEPYTTVRDQLQSAVTTSTLGAVEFGMYKREHVPQIGASLSKMERLTVAMNTGNDGNYTKLKAGYSWSDEQIQAILAPLTKQDWQFVQGVWDFIDSYWPQIEGKQKRVTGVVPERVEARSFTNMHGDWKGGYYPLKYEDRLSPKAYANRAEEAATSMLQGAYTRATTKRGHTIERVEGVREPVRLDFGGLFEHMHNVIHDLAFHEYLIDANKVLGHKQVQTAIIDTQGIEVYKQLQRTVEDTAAGEIPAKTAFEKSINWMRHGVSIAAMGWNLGTGLLQPLGISQSIQRIGAEWVFKGVTRFIGDAVHMENTAKWIHDKSEFMRNRHVTLNREINEIRNSIRGQTAMGAVGNTYFWLITRGQMIADIPTWIGQYEKMMHEGNAEERAIALADQAVLDSQGGGQIKDLAQIQRGGPLMRLWTNFYSYFNVTYNLTAESINRASIRDPASLGRLAVDMLLLYTIPAILGFMLKEMLRPKEGGSDDYYVRMLREHLSYMFGTMVGFREFSSVMQGYYGYEGPAGTRFYSEMANVMKQAEQMEMDEAAVKALNQTAGILFHYPAGQVQRMIDGYVALSEGRTSNPMALIVGPPKEK